MPKTPNVMGFSGSVNGTTKNPGFLDFGFCQCKWAYGKILEQLLGIFVNLSAAILYLNYFQKPKYSFGK